MIRRDISPERVRNHARVLSTDFDELWVVEDLPYGGGISQLSAVLCVTDQVRVGHGVAPTPFRNPVALAMEWATLARAHPGRLVAGLGHGVQDWMQQIGAAVASPLTLLDEQLTVIRTLLRGETVVYDGRYVHVDNVRLEFPPMDPVPVLAGVTGPRSLQLSGRAADGTILGEGAGPQDIQKALSLIAEGRKAGHRDDPHHLVAFAAFHLGSHDDVLADFDTSQWCAISHDGGDVAAELLSLFEAGADSVVLVPIGTDPVTDLARATADVLPSLRDAIGG